MDRTLLGRTCVVTGATGGIGLEVARGLALRGATVIMACRDRARGETARQELVRTTGNERLELGELELSLTSSVRAFAATLRQTHARLDVLVNNAATWPERRELTAEGVERTWATNVLGPFLLTSLLLEPLRAADEALVINVASMAAGFLDLRDPEFVRRRFVPFVAYAQSKQAVRMWTAELARRTTGSGVHAHAVHPGAVGTGLFDRHRGPLGNFMSWGLKLVGRTPAAGADTIVWLCGDGAGKRGSGQYWADRRVRPCRYARHPDSARLWERCAASCGLTG